MRLPRPGLAYAQRGSTHARSQIERPYLIRAGVALVHQREVEPEDIPGPHVRYKSIVGREQVDDDFRVRATADVRCDCRNDSVVSSCRHG